MSASLAGSKVTAFSAIEYTRSSETQDPYKNSDSKGSVSNVDRLWQNIQQGLNGVLLLMNKAPAGAAPKSRFGLTIFAFVVDFCQLLAFVLSSSLSEGTVLTHILQIFQFGRLFSAAVGYTVALVLTLVLVTGQMGNVIYVGYCWNQHVFHSLANIQVLRHTSSLFVGILFIPILSIFSNAFHCSPLYFNNIGMTQETCLSLRPFIIIVSAVFVALSLSVAGSFYEGSSLSKSASAQPHARVSLAHLGVKTVATIGHSIISAAAMSGGNEVLTLVWAGILAVLFSGLAYMYLFLQPFYHRSANTIRTTLMTIIAWVAITEFFVTFADVVSGTNEEKLSQALVGIHVTTNSTVAIMDLVKNETTVLHVTLLILSIALIPPLVHRSMDAYIQRLQSLGFKRCRTEFETELLARVTLHGIVEAEQHMVGDDPDASKCHLEEILKVNQKLIAKVNEAYKLATARFENSAMICAFHAQFLADFAPNEEGVVLMRPVILKGESRNPPFDIAFTFTRRREQLKRQLSDGSDIMAYVMSEKNEREAKLFDKKACVLLVKFWDALASEEVNLQRVRHLAAKIGDSTHRAGNLYYSLLDLQKTNARYYRQFASFLRNVVNDSVHARSFEERANRLEAGVRAKDNLTKNDSWESTSAVISISVTQNFGHIISVNDAACELLNEHSNRLIGKEVAQFLTPPLSNRLNEILKEYLENAKSPWIGRSITTYMLSGQGDCFEVEIELVPFTTDGMEYSLYFNATPCFRNNTRNYLLVASDGLVVGQSREARNFLQYCHGSPITQRTFLRDLFRGVDVQTFPKGRNPLSFAQPSRTILKAQRAAKSATMKVRPKPLPDSPVAARPTSHFVQKEHAENVAENPANISSLLPPLTPSFTSSTTDNDQSQSNDPQSSNQQQQPTSSSQHSLLPLESASIQQQQQLDLSSYKPQSPLHTPYPERQATEPNFDESIKRKLSGRRLSVPIEHMSTLHSSFASKLSPQRRQHVYGQLRELAFDACAEETTGSTFYVLSMEPADWVMDLIDLGSEHESTDSDDSNEELKVGIDAITSYETTAFQRSELNIVHEENTQLATEKESDNTATEVTNRTAEDCDAEPNAPSQVTSSNPLSPNKPRSVASSGAGSTSGAMVSALRSSLQKQAMNRQLHPTLKRLQRYTAFSMFLMATLATIVYALEVDLMATYNARIKNVGNAGFRRYYIETIASDVIWLYLENDMPLPPGIGEATLREDLLWSSSELKRLDLALFSDRNSFPNELRNYYESESVTVFWDRTSSSTLSLYDAVATVSGWGERIAEMSTLDIQLNTKLLYSMLSAILDTSVMGALMDTTSLYSQNITDLVRMNEYFKVGVAILSVLIQFVVLFRVLAPFAIRIDQVKGMILDVFAEIDATHLKQIAMRYRMRLHQVHDIAIDFDGGKNVSTSKKKNRRARNSRFRKRKSNPDNPQQSMFTTCILRIPCFGRRIAQKLGLQSRQSAQIGIAINDEHHQSTKRRAALPKVFLYKMFVVLFTAVLYFGAAFVYDYTVLSRELQSGPRVVDLGGQQRMQLRKSFLQLHMYAAGVSVLSGDPRSPDVSIDTVIEGFNRLDYLTMAVGYGNEEEGILGLLKSSFVTPQQLERRFDNGCLGWEADPSFVESMSKGNLTVQSCTKISGGLLKMGVSGALLSVSELGRSIARNIELDRIERFGDNYAARKVFNQSVQETRDILLGDKFIEISRLEKFYLQDQVSKGVVEAALMNQTVTVGAMQLRLHLLIAFIAVIVLMYVFFVQPMITQLDNEIKQTRALLLMIPEDVLEHLKSLKVLVLNDLKTFSDGTS